MPSRGEKLARGAADRLPVFALLAVFVVSRAVVYALGLRFDAHPLAKFIQFADPELLRHRLLQTLWYLHIQPPLYNLFIGVFLKAFPGHFSFAVHAVYLLIGLAATFGNYVLCVGLGLGRRLATGLAALLTIAPFTLVYENWLFYEYPMMVLLVLIGVATLRYARDWRLGDGILLFTLLALAIYTRQVFQLPWMLLLVVLLGVASRRPKAVLKAAAVPVLVVVLLYAKDYALFGVPSTSSWFGVNMARITLTVTPQPELQRLVREKKLSRIALIPPLSPLSSYRGIVKPSKPTGIPVLDDPVKSTGGVNRNAKPFIEISRLYATQSLRLVRNDPKQYAKGVAKASGLLSVPATNFQPIYVQRDKIRDWDRVFNSVVYLRLPGLHGIGWFLPLMYLGVLWFGTRFTIRVLRAGNATAREATLVVLIATVIYFLAVAALFDYGENQRVHLIIDDVLLILVATGLTAELRRRRSADRVVEPS